MLTREARNEMLETISDLSKDAYGYRVRRDYYAMTDSELQETWDFYMRAANDSFELEQRAYVRAEHEWEKHLSALIAAGAGNRATAIRWDMQAEDAGTDVGYYCFLKGIPYANEHEINATLA